jgi:amidase
LSDRGSIFARPLDRDFKGTRISFANLGLPYEPEVLQTVNATRAIFESLGCIVEEAEPDFSDADEIFKAWRAWSFEAGLSDEYQKRKDQLKDTVIWNIEQGLPLTGPYLARLEMKRTQLYHRLREFMQKYDFLILPVSQVLPFDVDHLRAIAVTNADLYRWMKSCYISGHPAIQCLEAYSFRLAGRRKSSGDIRVIGRRNSLTHSSNTGCGSAIQRSLLNSTI